MADEITVNGVDSIVDPITNGISKNDRDFEEHNKVSDLERKIGALEDEKLAIIRENEEQKGRIKLMVLEIDVFKKYQEEMEERLEKMRTEIYKSEDDKKALKVIAARASELETELFRLQHDLQSSIAESEDYNSELQKLTGEYEMLKQSNREKDLKISDLQMERDAVTEQMEKSKAGMGDRIRCLEEQVEALLSNKENFEKVKNEMETLKSSLGEKLKKLKEKSKERKKIQKELSQKNAAMEAKLIAYAEKKVEMEKKIAELEMEDEIEQSADGGRGLRFHWPVAAASTGMIAAAVAMIYLRNARQR